jgi:putative endonuclease
MTSRSELGDWGEKEAARYLTEKRYRVLERNVRFRCGELDIVAVDPDGVLVLVEVKTVTEAGPDGLTPEDQLTAGKLGRFRRAAALYASSRAALADAGAGWRLDVVAVTIERDDTLTFRHYENV